MDENAHYSLVLNEVKAVFDALVNHKGHSLALVMLPGQSGPPVTCMVTLLRQPRP